MCFQTAWWLSLNICRQFWNQISSSKCPNRILNRRQAELRKPSHTLKEDKSHYPSDGHFFQFGPFFASCPFLPRHGGRDVGTLPTVIQAPTLWGSPRSCSIPWASLVCCLLLRSPERMSSLGSMSYLYPLSCAQMSIHYVCMWKLIFIYVHVFIPVRIYIPEYENTKNLQRCDHKLMTPLRL